MDETEATSAELPRWAVPLGLLGVVVGVALRLYWVWLLPFNDAPDEYCHYAMVLLMRTDHRLPTMADVPARVPVSYPALPQIGYFPCAATLFAVKPYEPGAFRAARVGNVLVGALTLAGAFIAAILYFPRRPEIAVAATWGMALHPQLVFLNSYVNNDSSMVLTCTLLWLIWGWIGASGMTLRNAVALGVCCGVALMTKTNSVSVAAAGLPVLAMEIRRGKLPLCVLAACVTLLTCAPWFAWSYAKHGVFTGVEVHRQWWLDHLKSMGIKQGFLTEENFPAFAVDTWKSYWAAFGYCSTLLKEWQYHVVSIAAGAAFGLLASRGRHLGLGSRWLVLSTMPLGIALAFGLHAAHSANFGLTPQGRYMLSVEWPTMALIAAGFSLMWTGPIAKHGGTVLFVLFSIWLQSVAIDVEKVSNRYRQPDRRARCRLASYSCAPLGEHGRCISEQFHPSENSETTFVNGVYRWTGKPGTRTLSLDTQLVGRYFVLWIRPDKGLGNTYSLVASGPGSPPITIPFRPIAVGVCDYQFDLLPFSGSEVHLELRVEGDQELDLEIYQVLSR